MSGRTHGILAVVLDFLGPFAFDASIEAYSFFVGRPWQRRRARRLAKHRKIRCALFGASNPGVLPTRVLDGAAEVWDGRIRLWDAELWVQGVSFLPLQGLSRDSTRKGDIGQPTSDWCSARTLVYTLRTHRDHVKWAVLDWQAETALAMLGFPASERPNSP